MTEVLNDTDRKWVERRLLELEKELEDLQLERRALRALITQGDEHSSDGDVNETAAYRPRRSAINTALCELLAHPEGIGFTDFLASYSIPDRVKYQINDAAEKGILVSLKGEQLLLTKLGKLELQRYHNEHL